MELSPCERFLLEDSSSSDDSDIETLLDNNQQQMVVAALAVKELEDRKKRKRRGSKVGRLCVPRNRHLGNELLMRDYFVEHPTNSRYFTRRRNAAGLIGFSSYQKISAAMRVLVYGIPADYADDLIEHHWQLHGQ